MKYCKEWECKLVEYADGELPEDAREAVEAHVGGCAACRARLDGYRRDAALLAEAAACGVGKGTATLTLDKRVTRRRVVSRRVYGGLAAATCCVLVGGVALLRENREADAPTVPEVTPEQVAALEVRLQALEAELQRVKAANVIRAEAQRFEAESRREEMAAMGLAAGRQYESRGDHARALERYSHVASRYADTRSAARAEQKLKELAAPAV